MKHFEPGIIIIITIIIIINNSISSSTNVKQNAALYSTRHGPNQGNFKTLSFDGSTTL